MSQPEPCSGIQFASRTALSSTSLPEPREDPARRARCIPWFRDAVYSNSRLNERQDDQEIVNRLAAGDHG